MSESPDYTITWKINRDGASPPWLNILVTYPQPWTTNVQLPFDDATVGPAANQLDAPAKSISFEIVRPGGTFTFEGTVGDGTGSGTVTFALDAPFAEEVRAVRNEPLTAREQLVLGLFGVSAPYIAWLSGEFTHIELRTIMSLYAATVDEDDLANARVLLRENLDPGTLLMSKWVAKGST